MNHWEISVFGMPFKKKKVKNTNYHSKRCRLSKNQLLAIRNYVSKKCDLKTYVEIYNDLLEMDMLTDVSGNIAHISIINRVIKNLEDFERPMNKSQLIIDLIKDGLDWRDIREKTKLSRSHIQTTIRKYKEKNGQV